MKKTYVKWLIFFVFFLSIERLCRFIFVNIVSKRKNDDKRIYFGFGYF